MGSTDTEPSEPPAGGSPDWLDAAEFDDLLEEGMHVEDGNAAESVADDLDVEELSRRLRGDLDVDSELVNCLDAIIETFNARDLDGLLELVAEDCELPGLAGSDREGFAATLEDLWERRPTCLLTRGELEDEPVGVLWELGEGDTWWSIATVHVAEPNEGDVGLVEFLDDTATLDRVVAQPPDGDLDEGMRWREWEEGADV